MSAIATLYPVLPVGLRSSARTDDLPLAPHRSDRGTSSSVDDEFWRQRQRANAKRRVASLVLTVPLVALFGFLDGFIAPEARAQLWLIRFGIFVPVILLVLAVTVLQPLHRWSEAGVALGVVAAGGCITAMTLIAPPHFAGILILVVAAYTFLGLQCAYAGLAGVTVSLLYLVAAMVYGDESWPVVVANMFFLGACNMIGAFVCYMLERVARREFRHSRALSRQRYLSDRLLRNVLPASIARRLKSRSDTIADAHPDVTILFADIVNFTSYAATVTPAKLVRLLDQVFSCFDRLAQKHGLEKIKTIGDAYMAAGGLRAGCFDHARAVADMALDMAEAMGSFDAGNGRRLALRIGIHTGPVVAGVIGTTKFAYDLWGDTVNVASRLEGLAMPGTIQVGESTYEALRDAYVLSARQVVSAKGIGELPCYLLLARNSANLRCAPGAIGTRDCRSVGKVAVPTLAGSPVAAPA